MGNNTKNKIRVLINYYESLNNDVLKRAYNFYSSSDYIELGKCCVDTDINTRKLHLRRCLSC